MRPGARYVIVTVLVAADLLIDNGQAGGWPWAARTTVADAAVVERYTAARVGDWVEYRCTTASWETWKFTVIERPADAVTVRQERRGTRPQTVDVTIDLIGPPARVLNPPREELLGSGSETLTINGTKYDCQWTKVRHTSPGRVSLTNLAAQTVVTTKHWISKDVPVGRCVRWEAELEGKSEAWELIGYGRGK
jgi:hypothetical protein